MLSCRPDEWPPFRFLNSPILHDLLHTSRTADVLGRPATQNDAPVRIECRTKKANVWSGREMPSASRTRNKRQSNRVDPGSAVTRYGSDQVHAQCLACTRGVRRRQAMSHSPDAFDPVAIVVDWLDACRQRRLSDLLELYTAMPPWTAAKAAGSKDGTHCQPTGR
jgi:hypothetical protein